jgi:hypothetical protein
MTQRSFQQQQDPTKILLKLISSQILASSVPISINRQLSTTKELNLKEHQIIFRTIGESTTDVIFQHIHIPIPLEKINQIADKAIKKLKIMQTMYKRSHMLMTRKPKVMQDSFQINTTSSQTNHQCQSDIFKKT